MTVISLPSHSDYDAVFKNPDAKVSNQDFVILARLQKHAITHRIGFVTPKKKVRRAVDRNRFRRIIREYLRHQHVNSCADIVIIARQIPDGLWSAQYQTQLDEVFIKLFKTLHEPHGK